MVRALLAGLAVLTAAIPVPPSPQKAPFVGRADLVTVHASVTTSIGFRLTDLTKDEFEVLDNGRVRDIVQFSFTTRPVDVAILLDRSGTYFARSWTIPARTMLEWLQGPDRMSVHTLMLEQQELTADRTLLTNILSKPIQADSAKSIWRGVERVVRTLDDPERSRAVVMFTDGREGGADPPPRSLTELARSTDVGLYLAETSTLIAAPGRTSEYERRRQATLANLDFLIRTTGGRRITLPPPTRPSAVYRAFVDELRDQYMLGFQPESFDGKFHDLKVRVKRPDATVIARAGYLAVRR